MDSKILILLSAAALLLLIPNGYINAAAIIQKFEGFRSIPYYDVNGYAIGYGSKFNYDQNRPVLLSDRINQKTANRWLNIKIHNINALLNSVLKKQISKNQRDALISLIYNIGLTAFTNSTLLKKINQNDSKNNIAKEFDRWIYVDGKINEGLVKRRSIEKKIFLL